MRIKTLSFLVAVLLPVLLHAQSDTTDDKQHRIPYFNYISSGALIAKMDKGVSFSISTIHGIRIGKFFTGLGIGYDAYQEWRVLPLIASIGYDLYRKHAETLFFQLQGGYSLARNVPLNDFQPSPHDSKGGRMFTPSLGYRIKKENISLYLMAGYKFQRLDYEINQWWNPNNRSTVKHNIERVTIQIGFGLN
jgi:hypothetical protein